MKNKREKELNSEKLEENFDPHFDLNFIEQIEKESEEALGWLYNKKHEIEGK